MTKKLGLVTIIAGMLNATNVEAPANLQHFLPPIERTIPTKDLFKEYARKNEERFMGVLYGQFPYPREILKIIEHAKIIGLEPELLMAIRVSENGKDSVAYGILPSGKITERYNNDTGYIKDKIFHPYQNEKEKQLHWAAQTVRYYLNQFEENPKNKDFISYLAKRYAPIGAENDPHGLNKNWERNVKSYYKQFKRKSF